MKRTWFRTTVQTKTIFSPDFKMTVDLFDKKGRRSFSQIDFSQAEETVSVETTRRMPKRHRFVIWITQDDPERFSSTLQHSIGFFYVWKTLHSPLLVGAWAEWWWRNTDCLPPSLPCAEWDVSGARQYWYWWEPFSFCEIPLGRVFPKKTWKCRNKPSKGWKSVWTSYYCSSDSILQSTTIERQENVHLISIHPSRIIFR